MKRYGFISYLILACLCSGSAQNSGDELFSGCGTDLLLRKDPILRNGQNSLDIKLYEYLVTRQKERGMMSLVKQIPVVVHIIHNGGPENIPDGQVYAAISNINNMFQESDSVQIQFCLAQRDPLGNPTTGITRDISSLTNETMETDDISLKNINRWSPTCYLNIWIVNAINSLSSGPGVIGYAYLPSAHGMPMDGIVIEAGYFGSSPTNDAVGAHEIGHYLGLYHTFENACPNNNCLLDGDQVCDTPPDQTTFAICSPPANSCGTDTDDPSTNNPFTSDVPDLGNNYMDYSSLSCYNMFSAGQYERMNYFLDNVRSSLLECLSCSPPCPAPPSATITLPATSLIVTAGSSVNFAGVVANAIGEEWYLTPGSILSTASGFTHIFPSYGTFWMKYKAISGNPGLCLNGIDSVKIIVTQPPVNSCGGSLEFTGANSSVHLPLTNEIYSSSGFTWECWVKLINPLGPDWRPIIVSVDNVVYEDIALSFGWTGGIGNAPVTGLAFKLDGPGGPSTATCAYTPSGGFVLGTWYHVAASMNYSTNTSKLYLNGVLVDTKTNLSAPFSRIIASQLSWDVALAPGYPGPPLGGNMDEVRIWKKVRTDAEIAADHDHCLSGTETDLLVYYRADQTAGSTCLDATPAAYDGTLTSSALWSTEQAPLDATSCAAICNSTCPDLLACDDTIICNGAYVQLDVSGGYSNYSWSPVTGLSDPSIPNPLANPSVTTTYIVTGTNGDSNLVVNPDFALGNFGFTSGMTFTTTYSPCNYYVGPTFFTTSYPFVDHTPTADNYYMSVDGCWTGPTVLWEQSFSAITPGADYEFTFWATRSDAVQPDFEIHAIGDVTGDVIVATQAGIPYAGSMVWDQYGMPVWNSGPNNSVTWSIVNTETNGFGNDFCMDDFTFQRICSATDTVVVTVGSSPYSIDIGNDTTLCGSGVFVIDAGAGYQAYTWQDGSDDQTYTAFGPGMYWVTVVDACGGVLHDTLTITSSPSAVLDIISDTSICEGDSLQLGYTSTSTFSNFNWGPGTYLNCANCPQPVSIPSASILYHLVANTPEGCAATDSIYITVFSRPEQIAEIIVIEEVCGNGGGSVLLNITDNSTAPYLFNFNSSGYSASTNYENLVNGSYSLEIMDNRGCTFDTIIYVPDNVISDTSHVPNCFSPNNDGINDTWFIASFCGEKIHCKIFNRWGIEVAALDTGAIWDGKVKDEADGADGVYYYIAEVEFSSGEKKILRGFISLLR